MQDLWRLSATDLAALIKSKKVSAREAATSALARLEQANPLINAVVDYRPEYSLAQADAVDATIARGEMPGPLTGVPITIKVLTDQAGFATTNGLTLQRDLIARTNSPMVDNFLKAGAASSAAPTRPAFSYRWFTNNKLHGHTKNPRNTALTPGGSSGGASAATAAGIGHIGHGTDIAGSVRYPAYAGRHPRAAAHARPRAELQRIAARSARSARRSWRCRDHLRARSPTCASRWRRWPRRKRPMRVIPGTCRCRSMDQKSKSARRCASRPTGSRSQAK